MDITPFLICTMTIVMVFSFPSTVTAFRMNVFHVDSLLPKNLTVEERFMKISQRGGPRYLPSTIATYRENASMDALRPPIIKKTDTEYVAEVGVGTPPNPRLLFLDTGSHYTWMQCSPCEKCYTQTVPFFDPTESSSFKALPCNDPFCKGLPCVKDRCEYLIHYAVPADTKGYLFRETLTFASDGTEPEVRENIVLGCSFKTDEMYLSSEVSGILGLTMNPRSVFIQLIGNDRQFFGFCLPRYVNNQQSPGYLKFGSDAMLTSPDVHAIPFQPLEASGHLNLKLGDISVADHRIGFAAGTFDLKSDHDGQYGGFILDTGTTETLFEEGVYPQVRQAFEAYFEQFHLPRFYTQRFDVCYSDPDEKFDKLPSMTLHFQNFVDIVIAPDKVVLRGVGYFCVAMGSLGRFNIFGVLQLTDIHFSVDITQDLLRFLPGECGH